MLSPAGTAVQRASISYDLNWEAIIPRDKYNKFRCRFIFKSMIYNAAGGNGLLTDIGFVNMNLGRVPGWFTFLPLINPGSRIISFFNAAGILTIYKLFELKLVCLLSQNSSISFIIDSTSNI